MLNQVAGGGRVNFMTGKGMMSSIVLDCRLSSIIDCPCCRCLGHRQWLWCRLVVFAVGVVVGERRSGAASILMLEFVLMMRSRDGKKRRDRRRRRQEEEEEVSVLVLKEAGTAVGEIPGDC